MAGTFVPLGPRFEEALLYATRVHALQWRKGTAFLISRAAIIEKGATKMR